LRHSCEVNFCFVLFLMGFYGPCFYGSCSSTGFCVRVSSTGDTLLSFALETRFRASFRLPVSGWGNVSTNALNDFILGCGCLELCFLPNAPVVGESGRRGILCTRTYFHQGGILYSPLSLLEGGGA